MKHILIITALFAASIGSAQTKSVLKNINGGTITESLTIGSGKTLTIASGATINATGATITGFTASASFSALTGEAGDNASLAAALALKSPLASPTFTGTVTIPSGASISGYLTSATAASTYATIASLELKAPTASPIFTGTTETGVGTMTVDWDLGSITLSSITTGSISGNGSALTALNASNLGSGTVPTARLGSGTANSTTYLRGDNTWATVTGGVTSVSGTANEITVTGTTTPTLSLPAALTFTGKTITGGTFSSPTLTTPRIANGGYIADANGNESLIFTTTTSAVNELTLSNAATGGNPTFTASGDDTNIGETHTMKGTGSFTVRAGTASGNSQQWLNSSGTQVAYVRQDGAINTAILGLTTWYSNGLGVVLAGQGAVSGVNGIYVNSLYCIGPMAFGGLQSLSGAGAVNVTASVTKVTTTGAAQALTLADGTDGQIKMIIHAVDGGGFVLTPTTKTGFSSITSLNAGDTISLIFSTTIGWTITSVYGATVTP